MNEAAGDKRGKVTGGDLFAGVLTLWMGLNIVGRQEFTRSTFGIGVWLRLQGSQAALIGVLVALIGLSALWLGYIRRVNALLPRCKTVMRSVGLILVVMIASPIISDAFHLPMGIGTFIAYLSLVASLLLSVVVHSLVREEILKSANHGHEGTSDPGR